MKNFIARTAIGVLLMQGVPFADPRQEADQEYTWDCPGSGFLPYRRNLLVSTRELAEGIETSEVTIIHVGFEPSGSGIRRASYEDGHIPGARHWKWSDLKGPLETLRPAMSRWPALAALGLPREGRVVLYDTGLGLEAAAAFVVLESLGLAGRVALLNGQWVKWVAEGRPLRRWGEEGVSEDLAPRPSGVALSPSEAASLLLEAGQSMPNVTLLDARVRGDDGRHFAGPTPIIRKAWLDHFASLSMPVLKSEVELRTLWASVPPRPDQRIVVAARHWREAAHVYFVARLLGYSVQLLDGSFEDLETLERGS